MCFCSETVPLRPGPEAFSRCAGQLAACPARTDSCPQRKKPRPRGLSIQYQFGKNNHFVNCLLSSRLYCRFWNCTKSAACAGRGLSPPVGNCTPPRRTVFIAGCIVAQNGAGYKSFLQISSSLPAAFQGDGGGPEGTKIAATPDPIRNPSHSSNSYKAGEEGLEPPSTVLETAALPLNYSPLCCT